ncbi:EscU/YscU/HrcU family type III secretion system export apparatus switch protein [Roseomonas marmotae]|uniref:Flagellar biosynthesis protein FlhB n=1 Tax=Roseomonas marmotae TaxID=2768161 RepID=A0ABS3KGM5_9PROT|nr:flagellar type III secretion system protein FlhB [Roseomonas marmotae]MBO1076127.1 flagellar biosynthesis protein FlhB [Roseomonas marmotae]QTI81261.1 flagellar biosynthesis protein FlhB [Roseomonas marmotae]
MAEESGQEKTLDASPRKLEQARQKGDVPSSREGSNFGLYAAMLLAIGLAGGLATRRVGEVLLPLIEQPEAFLALNALGFRAAGQTVAQAMAIALLPVFGLLMAGALLPHLLQNTVVVSGERLRPKFSHISPMAGLKRILGPKSLFEFGKNMVKAGAVAMACWIVGRPLYRDSAGMAALDPAAFPGIIFQMIVAVLGAVTLVAAVIAVVDIGFQRFHYARRQRMTLQEMREEMRSTEGDPHLKAARRRKQRQGSQRRMMADVPTATVVLANPTHFAVALRYERGQDHAPVCVAKGVDALALRIRALAEAAGVAVVEDKPLARALHASVELGETIPPAHFEAVARVIGIIWAQQGAARRKA